MISPAAFYLLCFAVLCVDIAMILFTLYIRKILGIIGAILELIDLMHKP